MILITGTTGLVGTHLLAKLLQNEEVKTIRGLYRSEEKKQFALSVIQRVYGTSIYEQASKIDWHKADITDVPALYKVFENITRVYHCAGLVSNNPALRKKLRKINIEGTANMVNFSIEFKIEKFCHVSSIATLGREKNNILVNEESYRENLNNSSHYSIAKYGGEMEVWRASQEGLPVVIVNPGVILGEGFYTDGSGALFLQTDKNFPFKIEKKTGFVGVKDVVEIMVLLMKSEQQNRRFILVEQNIAMSKVQALIAQNLDKKVPSIKLKLWMVYLYWFLEAVSSLITRKPRKLSFDVIATLLENRLYCNKRIKTTLDYQFTPIDKVVAEASKDYLSQNEK